MCCYAARPREGGAMKRISDNFRVMWIISCILILIIPILISGITGTRTIRELENANAVNNELIVKQIQKEMDFAVDNIFRMKMELMSNHDIYVVSSINGGAVRDYQYELSRVYDALRVYQSSMENVEGYFIYFNNINTVVSLDGIFDADEYYERYCGDAGRTREQWLDRLGMETNGYFENSRRQLPGGVEERMQYYCSLRMLGQVNPPMFCAFIGQAYLNDILQSTTVSDAVYTLVVDQDKNLLLGNSKSAGIDTAWPRGLDFSQPAGYFSSDINGERVMVSYVTGKYTDWKYMCVSPAAEFWSQVNWLRGLTLGGLVLSFLFGCLCIWGVIRKNYSPMEHILTVLKKALPEEETEQEGVGEYRYIESALTQVLEQKERAVDTVERQKKPLQDSFVIRLLSGNIGSLPSIEDALSNIDLRFEKKNFLVLALYVEDYSVLFQEEEGVEDSQRVSLTHFILSNVLGELFSGEYSAHMVILEEMPVFLINLDYAGKEEDVSGIVRYAQEFLNANFGLDVKAGLSEAKSSYEGIAEAYDEAVETVEYKVLLGREDILYYHEMPKNKDSQYRYGYSIEHEQKLIAAVQSGDAGAAGAVLNQIFDSMRGTTDLNIAKCFMFDVGSTIIKTIEEIRPQWDEENSHLLLHVQKLLESSSISRMQSGLQELLQEMCGYFEKKNQELRLSDRIHSYLLSHYGDINLNVAAIGEEFGMVPRYISKVFKDETGEGLLDHINRLRIQQAKKIMQNKNLVLEDVAGQVGFTNVNSFIRVFKKYEGITPGKYRESL